MAEGRLPLLKKLVFGMLRDELYSATPTWVVIDDVYNDCSRRGLDVLPHAVRRAACANNGACLHWHAAQKPEYRLLLNAQEPGQRHAC